MSKPEFVFIGITKKDLLAILCLNCASILLIICAIFFSQLYYPYSNIINFYDVQHYISIATDGYSESNPRLYAFMPFFPLLLRYLGFGFPVFFATMLNTVLFVVSSILIFKISKEMFELTSRKSLLVATCFIFNPFRFVYFIPYTESLFLFLCITSWYLWKRNKNPLIWGGLLGLALATRNTGALLAISLGLVSTYGLWNNQVADKVRNYFTGFGTAFLIGSLYPVYLHFATGSYKKFIEVQYTHWGRIDYALPFDLLWTDISTMPFHFQTILTIFSLCILLAGVVFFFSKTRNNHLEIVLFSVFSIIVLLVCGRGTQWLTPASASTGRYVFGMFSLYLFLTQIKKQELMVVLSFVSSLLITAISLMLNGFLVWYFHKILIENSTFLDFTIPWRKNFIDGGRLWFYRCRAFLIRSSSNCFFHCRIWLGWTWNLSANAVVVCSPFMSSNTTLA